MATSNRKQGSQPEQSRSPAVSRGGGMVHPLSSAAVQRAAAVEQQHAKAVAKRQLDQVERAIEQAAHGSGEADVDGDVEQRRTPRLQRRSTLNDVLFPPQSLCGIGLSNPIRVACIRIMLSEWFNGVIIALIALNCVFLCLYDPLNPTGTTRAQVLELSEYVFTGLFTVEAVIKIVAFGFVVPKKAYMRNPWNVLDFFVVSMGYISLIPGVSNVSSLRTFRVLRPLRTLTTVPGMRIIVTSMLSSLPALLNVVLLCTFIFFVFGIIGLQLWAGVLRGRCHFVASGLVDPLDDRACALPCTASIYPSFPSCPFSTGRTCAPVPTRTGYEARECLPLENRNFGFTSFDNIGTSILAIFTSITLEGWSDILYDLLNSFGVPGLTIVYFILLILFGSYFLLNLTLAVIWAEYEKAMDELRAKEARFLEELINNDLEDDEMRALSKVMGIGSVSRAVVLNIRAAKALAAAGENAVGAVGGEGAAAEIGTENGAQSPEPESGDAAIRPDQAASHDVAGVSAESKTEGHAAVASTFDSRHAGRPNIHQEPLPPLRGRPAPPASGSASASAPDTEDQLGEGDVQPPGADAGAGLGPDLLARDSAQGPDRRNVVQGILDGAATNYARPVPRLNVDRLNQGVLDRGENYETERSRRAAAHFVTSALQENSVSGQQVLERAKLLEPAKTQRTTSPRKKSPRDHFETQHARNVWDELERMKDQSEYLQSDPTRGAIPRLQPMLASKSFNVLVVVVIILNTAALGAEYYGMSTAYQNSLEYLNYAFTGFFTVEVILKLLGLGWGQFANDRFNIFDLVVVILSLVEVLLSLIDFGDSSGLSALRSFRLLRVFKLARSWKSLRELLATITQSVIDVSYASVVLLILIFIFTLLGLQLHGGKYTVTSTIPATSVNGTDTVLAGVFDEKPRAHFDTLYWSFVTVFQVLTGENWNEVLYDAMQASGPAVAVTYFVLLNVIGNYLILNLFLTILLANFEGGDVEPADDASGDAVMIEQSFRAAGAQGQLESPRSKGFEGQATRQRSVIPSKPRSSQVAPMQSEDDRSPLQDKRSRMTNPRVSSIASLSVVKVQPDGRRFSATGAPLPEPTGSILVRHFGNEDGSDEERDGGDKDIVVHGWSLYMFHESNPIRRGVAWFVRHKNFDRFILFLIVISSILLALDEPRIRECNGEAGSASSNCAGLYVFLQVADGILTAVFAMEAVLKIIAMGFALGPYAYLKNGWNILDFSIVIISIVSVFAGGNGDLKALRALRALRGLRPLRAVSRFPGLKVIVNSMFRALPAVGGAAAINALFLLIFAIIGMQNWLGKLNVCNDSSVSEKVDCVGSFNLTAEQCSMMPTEAAQTACLLGNDVAFARRWQPQTQHFNHLGAAMLTVFEVATGEMWPDIMHATVDAVGVDKPQERDHNPAAALYFIMIQVVCNFLMLNVFVGVVVENFNQQKQEHDGSALLTPAQRLWVEQTKIMLNSQPAPPLPPPSQSYRLPLFRVVTHRRFEFFIMGCILANALLMATRHFGQANWWTVFLEVMNGVFVGIFTLEAVLKLVALGPREYFKRKWNCFDFTLVVSSFVGLALPGDATKFATLARIIRVARLVRLVRTSTGLLNLFKTLIFSLPSLGNIGAVLLLVFFIFAVLGMNLFSDVKHGEFLNSDANFETFGGSLLTLFRITTGESFNGIMHDCSIQPPYCDPDGVKNCGDPLLATAYIVLFLVVVAFGILNFLVAVLIDSFSDTVAISEAAVTPDDIDEFKALWTVFDPQGAQFITKDRLVEFLQQLRAPLGVAGMPGVLDTKRAALRLIHQVDIPVHINGVQYNEVLLSLANRASKGVGDTLPQDFSGEMNKIKFNSIAYKKGTVLVGDPAATATSRQHGAAMLIQAAWRGHVIRAAHFRAHGAGRGTFHGLAGGVRGLHQAHMEARARSMESGDAPE